MAHGPRPADVEFDDVAAKALVAEISNVLRLLNETERARRTSQNTAKRKFFGVYSQDFQDALDDLATEVSATRRGLRDLRRQIREALAEARSQRVEVAAAQEEWDEQQAREAARGNQQQAV